ncbi:MAG: hypothetical protein AUJ52_09120 [Elusimicrobia bacterium CG1_02_63_36]|nr:MAG: hypothetical protein AUJ52_09120 [Elusimicrobia bacterium CG1_02_63_36]
MTDPLAHIKSSSIPKRSLITLGLLAAYRLGAAVPVPGAEGLGLFSAGILPYVAAAVAVSLAAPFVGTLAAWRRGGKGGRESLFYATRFAGFAVSAAYAYRLAAPGAPSMVTAAQATLTLTAGAILLLWIAEEITDSGIGNGVILILLVDAVLGFGGALSALFARVGKKELDFFVALLPVLGVLLVWACVVAIETAHRKFTVRYSAKIVGRQMMAGQKTTLPVKVNAAGILGAAAVLPLLAWLPDAHPVLIPVIALLVGFFTFYFNDAAGDPKEMAATIQTMGGYLPGVRSGEATVEHFENLRDRLSLGSAFALAALTAVWESVRAAVGLPASVSAPVLVLAGGAAFDLLNQAQGRAMLEQNDGSMLRAAERAREAGRPRRRGTQRKKKKRR